eukprot:Tbor_TRINITY_DN5748_c1_g1::TRINITY_DN5748_c1_g1_i1::g.20690::m.20690
MPAKKKEEKKESEEIIEETGTYVFGDDIARYNGIIIKKDGVCKRNGTGEYTDGHIIYIGEWQDDTMHGQGKLTYLDTGTVYTGGFYKGQYDGVGVIIYGNGDRYSGQWRANRMHGEGEYMDGDSGKIWRGRFYNGTGPGLRERTGWGAL